jgi:hypothetical protein
MKDCSRQSITERDAARPLLPACTCRLGLGGPDWGAWEMAGVEMEQKWRGGLPRRMGRPPAQTPHLPGANDDCGDNYWPWRGKPYRFGKLVTHTLAALLRYSGAPGPPPQRSRGGHPGSLQVLQRLEAGRAPWHIVRFLWLTKTRPSPTFPFLTTFVSQGSQVPFWWSSSPPRLARPARHLLLLVPSTTTPRMGQ